MTSFLFIRFFICAIKYNIVFCSFMSDIYSATCFSPPSHTASSPECQLLKQVTRGPWGLPMDPTLRRGTDTTAVQLSEMVSLPVLIKHSVTTPLITQWVSDWKAAGEGKEEERLCFVLKRVVLKQRFLKHIASVVVHKYEFEYLRTTCEAQ